MSPSTPEAGPAAARTRWQGFAAARRLLPWRAVPLLLQDSGLWDGERRWPGFDDWCAAHPRRACELWLSSALLHELVCDPGLPLPDDAAALVWAQTQLLHYHGEPAAGWPLAAWQQGRQRGVSVLHGASLAGLCAAAARHGVRLGGLRPWWAGVLRLACHRHPELRRAQARLLVLEGCCMAVADLRDGQLVGLQLRRLDEATPQALSRWCVEGGTPEAGPVFAVGYGLAAGPVGGVQAPDALHAPAAPPRWLSALQP